jgi:UDP-3-O-[3-hydroxymyristoyl] glucosamine N-acyltransferase
MIGGKAKIGEDCLIHQGVMIADYVKIGNRVILQQGASIGADGFGYVTARPSNLEMRQNGDLNAQLSEEANPLIKIPQTGTVVIEDDVEVGSNTCIDRATMGATVIGAGTKIDDMVMIAHNCRFGRECIVVAGTAIAGSCTFGDRVVLAGQVGIKDHIRVGKDAMILAQAGVMEDVAAAAVVVGSPAIPVKEKFTQIAYTKKLPSMAKELKEMRKKIEQLEKALLERQLEASAK